MKSRRRNSRKRTKCSSGFVTSKDSYLCRKVILAVGLLHYPRKLPVLDGLQSSKVFYKMPKIGDYEGDTVAVVGGGDSALDAAVMVLERGGAVEMVIREEEPIGKADSVRRVRESGGVLHLGSEIESAAFDGGRMSLQINDGAKLAADCAIVQNRLSFRARNV